MNGGAFGENFPYVNFHDLNLDWIVKIAKDFLDQYTHIQEVISNGEIALDNKTTGSLEQLTESATNIQNDLNNLYDHISEDLKNQLATDIETMQTRFGNLLSTIPADFSGLVSQVNVLSESLKYARPINILTTTPINGYYVSYESGAIGANAEWAYYPQFEIEGGKYYYGSYNSAHVAFFDYDHNFISGIQINHVPTNEDFITPSNAKFATYSYKIDSGDQYLIRSTDSPLQYTNPAFRTLEPVVSASLLNLTDILTTGKNLFNKYNLIEGYSIDYGNANRLWRNSTYCYCPDFIPVKPNTTYHHNRAVIIGIYDDMCNLLETLNHTVTADDTFTTGATAKYIKIGTLINAKDILQVEEGTAGSSYETFGITFKHNTSEESITKHIIIVKPTGGDYTRISDAIGNSNTGDIILIYPGTYNESVKAYNKNVHLIGLNRTTCILQYSARDYANPPLEIANGSVENITIKAVDSGSSGNYNAYCVHCDNDNEANNGLYFRNVEFINELHQCVGVGLRAHFTITFDSCSFVANNQACLYCHDWETDSTGDKTGQKLIVRNCTLENNSAVSTTIMLQTQELETDVAEVTFFGNSVVNKNDSGSLISMTRWKGRTLTNNSYLGSSDWVLAQVSSLNTENLMNSIKIPSRNDIIAETVYTTNSDPISPNSVKSFNIPVTKQGYTPIGIIAITGTSTSGLAMQEFYIHSDNATVYFRNTTANNITPSKIEMTILYKAD